MRYFFEDAELNTSTFSLHVDGEHRPVEPQVFEVLAYLIEHRDRLVLRTELLDEIWGDRFVSDSALASRIAAARAAIGDDGRSQRLIKTVHGRGLRFVGQVTEEQDPAVRSEAASRPELAPAQTVRFVDSYDGTRLAVASVGEGTPLVKAANWLTHVEDDWTSPVWRHWMTELGRRSQFIRYDSRGCGLSDRDLSHTDITDLDVWIGDLEAVVDSSGLDRFALLGVSQGAGCAIGYAVRHPERVSHLVLYGGYARGWNRRGEQARAQADALLNLMRVGWGGETPAFRSIFTMTFMPDATSEQMRWFNDLQIRTTSPANAVLLESAFYDQDFTALASQVEVPTMVIHCSRDRATPYEEGRRLASAIPGATFVTLDSRNHILTADEPAWPRFLDHLDQFVGFDRS